MGLWRAPQQSTPLSLRASQLSRGTPTAASIARALADGPDSNEPSDSGKTGGTQSVLVSGGAGAAGTKTTVAAAAEDDEEHDKLVLKEQRLSWDDIERMGQNAQRVRAEILTTEGNYLANLRRLHKAYVVPLKQTEPEELGIEDFHQRTLVSNLEQLLTVHSQFNEDLARGGAESVENIMINYSRYFKMYSVYLNDYLKCLTTLESLRRSKVFQGFLGRVNERLKEESSLGLMDYLIMPVQRLPRYVLLLRELRRNTLPSTAGYDLVNTALVKVRETATAVNEKAREAEKMQELAQIYHSLTGDVKDLTLIEAHRRLIRKGELQLEESRRGGLFGGTTYQKTSPRIVFLFNDIIMWTNKGMVFKAYMTISSLTVEPTIPASSTFTGSSGFGCSLTNSKGSLTLHFANEEEFASWMPDISNNAREQKMMRVQKRGILSARVQNNAQAHQKTAHSLIVGGLTDLGRRTLQRQTLNNPDAVAEGGAEGDGSPDGGDTDYVEGEGVTPPGPSPPDAGAAGAAAPPPPPPPPPAPAAAPAVAPVAAPAAAAGPRQIARGTGGAGARLPTTNNLAGKLAELKLKQQQRAAAAPAPQG
jgi:hypothetical protein